ncbi:LPS ABC transporter substrate-binding protein LptA [Phyllobacterium phragmitis]|uniref:LPS ABC transporter substrate-binding protein LptA n=1 Tax=Phyllobacterium phragmitis TaxID=2670329 RepID=A0A2S9IS61_9HYPH|nr:LptA/OstA family protein [Phyllobacterium phragmitis]PRD43362.1 LPS ABC transporter substrate-binding protein LptA [Phyllobacterium phragmitis]
MQRRSTPQDDLRSKHLGRRFGSAMAAMALFAAVAAAPAPALAQQQQQAVPFGGLNFSNGKEPVQINADRLEMRDKEGIAIFTGNVSVVQGQTALKSGKMTVYYAKSPENDAKSGDAAAQPQAAPGLGAAGVDRLEVSGKVYLKSGTQVATGDSGTYDAKTQTMTLLGKKVVLSDGENVATGCKLTANTGTGRAFLESCKGQPGRVSIILAPKSAQQQGNRAGSAKRN